MYSFAHYFNRIFDPPLSFSSSLSSFSFSHIPLNIIFSTLRYFNDFDGERTSTDTTHYQIRNLVGSKVHPISALEINDEDILNEEILIDQNDTQKQEENGINEIGINGQSNRNDEKNLNDEKNRNENGNDEDDDRSLCTNNTDGVVSTNSTEQIVRALGGDVIGVNNSGSNIPLNNIRHHTPTLSPTHIQNRDTQNRDFQNRISTNTTDNFTSNTNNFSNNFTDLLIHQQTGTLDHNSNLNSMEYMQIPKSLKLNRIVCEIIWKIISCVLTVLDVTILNITVLCITVLDVCWTERWCVVSDLI